MITSHRVHVSVEHAALFVSLGLNDHRLIKWLEDFLGELLAGDTQQLEL